MDGKYSQGSSRPPRKCARRTPQHLVRQSGGGAIVKRFLQQKHVQIPKSYTTVCVLTVTPLAAPSLAPRRATAGRRSSRGQTSNSGRRSARRCASWWVRPHCRPPRTAHLAAPQRQARYVAQAGWVRTATRLWRCSGARRYVEHRLGAARNVSKLSGSLKLSGTPTVHF